MGIFKVTRKDAPNDPPRMVEASNVKAAINYVAGSLFSADKVTVKDALSLSVAGVRLETAGDDPKAAERAESARAVGESARATAVSAADMAAAAAAKPAK